MKLPPVVSPAEWRSALEQLRAKEKLATRARDALAAERRRLPRVRIEREHVLAGPTALDAPAGGICDARRPVACWKETRAGFRYLDPPALRHGLRRIDLSAGPKPGKSRVALNARGSALGLPSLPLASAALPLRVQLRSSDGECWEAVYGALKVNKRHGLRARSD